MDKPFIVINSGALKLLDDDEMRTLLGHEVGHVMSGHALYVTILILILNFSFTTLPFLAGIALLPIRIALLEWFRKSELSSDRAGLLAAQDANAAMRMYLKMAGGGDMKQMDLNAFLEQAKEYEESGGPLDRIFQILNTLERTHPFNTLRAAELQRWIEAGQYERILNGEYTRRGPDAENRPIDKDIDEARDHYMKEAKAVVNDVVDSAKRAAQAFSDAFKKRREHDQRSGSPARGGTRRSPARCWTRGVRTVGGGGAARVLEGIREGSHATGGCADSRQRHLCRSDAGARLHQRPRRAARRESV